MEILLGNLKHVLFKVDNLVGNLHVSVGADMFAVFFLILGAILGSTITAIVLYKWLRREIIFTNWRENWKELIKGAISRRLKVRFIKYFFPFFIFIPVDVFLCHDMGSLAKFVINFACSSEQFGQSCVDIFEPVGLQALQLVIDHEHFHLSSLLQENALLSSAHHTLEAMQLQEYAWLTLRNFIDLWPYLSFGQITDGFKYLISPLIAYFLDVDLYDKRVNFLTNVYNVFKGHVFGGSGNSEVEDLRNFISTTLRYSGDIVLPAFNSRWH